MIYVIFDTETTGFTSKDEVIQFSGVITDEHLEPIRLFDFYCDTARKSHPDALMLHRITQEELHKRSMGKTLEDHIAAMSEWFKQEDVIWVGYNVPFDIRLVTSTLKNNGAPLVDFGTETTTPFQAKGRWFFDLMKYYKGYKFAGRYTLADAVNDITGFSKEQLASIYTKMTKKSVQEVTFHRADFDSLITWVLFVAMMAKESA